MCVRVFMYVVVTLTLPALYLHTLQSPAVRGGVRGMRMADVYAGGNGVMMFAVVTPPHWPPPHDHQHHAC